MTQQGQKPSMLTSVDPVEAERRRMATLMMDTISSEAESHATSHFIGDKRRPLLQQPKQLLKDFHMREDQDPDYMQRVRAVACNSTQDFKGHINSGRDGSGNLSPNQRDNNDVYGMTSARDQYQIGDIPSSSRPPQLTTLEPKVSHNDTGMLVLASRPQNYDSISLTNSTEFGQHSSVGSSIDNLRNFQYSNQKAINKFGGGQATVDQNNRDLTYFQMGQTTTSSQQAQQQHEQSLEVKAKFEQEMPSKQFLPKHSTILEDLKEEDISFAQSSKVRPAEQLNRQFSSSRPSSSSQNSKILTKVPHLTETDESLGSASEGTGTRRQQTTLSNQDDELIEELARTCFKSGGFYQPSKDTAAIPDMSLSTSQQTEQHDVQQPSQSNAGKQAAQKEVQKRAEQPTYHQQRLQSLVTPDVGSRRMAKVGGGNDLIKIDESQFVTLSQVQNNRVQTSSGRSAFDSSSIHTEAIDQSALSTQYNNRVKNYPPSSADLVSENYPVSSQGVPIYPYQADGVMTPSSMSTISNQLFQTQVEHTQGRLAFFNSTTVGDVPQSPAKLESQKSVLEQRAQKIGLAAQVSNPTLLDGGHSTAAQTQLEALRDTGKFQQHVVQRHNCCQGCNQALIQTHRMMAEGRSSIDSSRLRASSSEQKGVNDLLTSGAGSYSQILCDDCMSRQLQSSDGGSLQHSLRFSQLLKDQQQQPSSRPPIQTGAFSSYQRFTQDESVNTPSNSGSGYGVNKAILRDQTSPVGVTRDGYAIIPSYSALEMVNSDIKSLSYLQQSQQSQHTASGGNLKFLQNAATNAVLLKSDLKLDQDSMASSLDSRFNPSHLVWSHHKAAQSQHHDEQQLAREPSQDQDGLNRVAAAGGELRTEAKIGLDQQSLYHSVDKPAGVVDTASSLQFLSYLSSTANNVAKEKQIETQLKYSNVNSLLSSAGGGGGVSTGSRYHLNDNVTTPLGQTGTTAGQDYLTSNYKAALRNFMDRQMERSTKGPYSGSSSTASQPMSRIFRERQSRRMFEDLQSLKGSCAKTYEELEQMHASVLLGKGAGGTSRGGGGV